ncbi:ABC transporter ATP-binding protein [Halorarum halobium]|uniref:ABC transporter ATP-binding protein n=1 Tax=Halorarum halobium TaxID=3075121 RepID=UPI0028B2486F|nr:oligopeptide/dipeptide ABC transporter ATP-binding protein [Halobaculum sp. XH14]
MSDPLLSVRDLEKYFPIKSGLFQRTTGHVKAVDGVSFDIERGETLALIGESGSGKSTVAETIIGLKRATGGTVTFDGEDVTDLSDSELEALRTKVQMVFQDPTSSLNPRRTVEQTLEVPLKARGVARADRVDRIERLLERVELNPEHRHRYPHELSGGQKQRINIARAISIEPELLILDEPTSALDVSVQAKIVRLLDDLQDEFDLTYLFITHDLSLVRNVAERTAVMYLGQIQERGPTRRLFEQPHHPYTQALLSAIPVTSEDEEAYKPHQERLEGEIPSPENVPSGCRFHTRCPYATDVCETDRVPLHSIDAHGEARCHIYHPEHAEAFEDAPAVEPVAATERTPNT